MKHYILKTTQKDGITYNDFQWPTEVGSKVTAPDWEPTTECGNGFHGWLNGRGKGTIGHINQKECLWMVLETDSYIDLEDKVKFESCTILHVGDRLSATKFLRNLVPDATRMIGESIEVGDKQDAIVGDYGTATAGGRGTATVGYMGTATAGDKGTATAGNYGTATVGYMGTATAGDGGTATAGEGGTIQIKYYDGSKYRILTGYIGEDGLESDTPYKVENGEFVKA
jgi:hypothetical protein